MTENHEELMLRERSPAQAITSTTVSLAVLTIALLFSGSGEAADNEERGWSFFFNSLQVYQRCDSPRADDQAWCSGYVAGVMDAFGGTNDPASDASSLKGCFEKQVSLGEARRFVVENLKSMYADAGEKLSLFPGSRGVIAAVSNDLCDDFSARADDIESELGPQPPFGTTEYDEYVRVKGCMLALKWPQSDCRKLVRDAMHSGQ